MNFPIEANLYIALVAIPIVSKESGLRGYDCKDLSFSKVSYEFPYWPGDSYSKAHTPLSCFASSLISAVVAVASVEGCVV